MAAFDAPGVAFEDVRISPGLGTVRLSATVDDCGDGAVTGAIAALRHAGLNVLLLAAPKALYRSVDAFGTSEASLELMRQLKRQFDPRSVLNPGRVIPEL
jgi:FAD/FMN-containing dehydrogenase